MPLPAAADDSTVTGSWFFAEQPEPLPPPIGAPAAVPTPDVPSGDFAVAAKPAPSPDQQSDKESYLHVDLSAVSQDASLSALKLTLKEDSAGGNVNAASATVAAHLVTEFFADGAAGSPYSQRPKFDATATAKGTRAADGTWTFDLGSLVAGKPVSAFFGVALVPAPATAADGFEVVWAGKAATASYTVSAAPGGSASTGTGGFATAPGAVSSPPASPGASAPSSVSSPSLASGSTGGGSFLAPPAAVATSDSGATAAPATTATTAPTVAAAPAATTAKKAAHSKHGLPWTFVPAVLALLVLLGGAAVALGQAGEPVPARQGSVVRRLERPADVPG